MKKGNEKKESSNRNRLQNHQIIYNDHNGLIGITSSTASHVRTTRSSFFTWLGRHTQNFQMRISIHIPIAILTYFQSLSIFPPSHVH